MDGKKKIDEAVKDEDLVAEAAAVAAAAAAAPAVVDPDVADYMGAFEETALDVETALDSMFDEEDAGGAAHG